MKPQLKNMERIQNALKQLQRLTPQQINGLKSHQNFNQLRLKNQGGAKSRLMQNQIHKKQQKNDKQLHSIVQNPIMEEGNAQLPRRQTGIRWQLFKEMPIIEARHQSKNYEKEFQQKIQKYRQEVRKDLQKKNKEIEQQSIKYTYQQQPKPTNMFSAVLGNQTGPIFTNQSKEKSNSLFQTQNASVTQQPNSQKNERQNIFSNKPQVSNNPFQPPHKQSTNNPFNMFANQNKQGQTMPKINLFSNQNTNKSQQQNKSNSPAVITQTNKQEQQAKPIISGFIPGINIPSNGSSIFQRKLQTPQISAPQPIKLNAGLFSQSNPLYSSQQKKKENVFSHQDPAPLTNMFNPPTLNIIQAPSTNMFNNPTSNMFSAGNKKIQKDNKLIQQNNQAQRPKKNQSKQKFASQNLFNLNTNKIPLIQSQKNNQNIQVENPIINSSLPNSPINSGMLGNHPQDKKLQQSNKINQTKIINTNNPPPAPIENSIFKQKQPQFKKIEPIINNQNNQKPTNEDKSKKQETKTPNIFTNSFNSKKQDTPQPKPQPQPVKQQKNIFGVSNLPNVFTSKIQIKPVKFQSLVNTKNQSQQHSKRQPNFFQLKTVTPADFFIGKVNKQQTQKPQQSNSNKNVKQIFGDFMKKRPDNVFTKDNSNKLSGAADGLFGAPTGNVFGSTSNSLFGNAPANNIFGRKQQTASNNQFVTDNIKKNNSQDEDQGMEEEEEQGIEDKEQIDPLQSTGNYKYLQSSIIYKQSVLKFKQGNQNVVQNGILSIQKIPENKHYNLIIRLTNKQIYFTGIIMPKHSKAEQITQKSFKSLKIIKVGFLKPDKTLQFESFKIQFKQQKHGRSFFDKFNQIAKE